METETPPVETPLSIIAETEDYRVRALTPEEFTSKKDQLLHYPFIPDPLTTTILVVEDKQTGGIVASWMAMTTVFLEGLYVTPEARGTQFAIQRLLLGGMLSVMADLGVAHPLTLAQDPSILAMARKAGFAPVAGTLLMLE